MGYIEFITVDHATAALRALQSRIVNGDETLKVAYATPLKAWTPRSDVDTHSNDGDELGPGPGGGDATLFQVSDRKDEPLRLEEIATDLGKQREMGNEERHKELVHDLVENQEREKALRRQEFLRTLEAARKQSPKPDKKPV